MTDKHRTTYPYRAEIGVTELKSYTIDFAARLGSGEGVSGVVGVTVMHLESKVLIADAVSGIPSLVGSIVTVTVDGSKLEPQTEYLMVTTAVMNGRQESTDTILETDY